MVKIFAKENQKINMWSVTLQERYLYASFTCI